MVFGFQVSSSLGALWAKYLRWESWEIVGTVIKSQYANFPGQAGPRPWAQYGAWPRGLSWCCQHWCLALYCLLGYKRIRRQKHDSETGERIRASQGICERLSLYLRRQNADINCRCHFWSIVRHVQCLSPRREDHLSQCPGECHECHEPPHEAHFQNILTPRLLFRKEAPKSGCCINFQTVVCSLLGSIAL